MEHNFKFIELFAGCGGMSLGLKSAGFNFFMGNELSPMASETYAYNLLGEDLKEGNYNKTIWIESKFPKRDSRRLNENPFEISKRKYSDLDITTDLHGKFLIGDIYSLLAKIRKNKTLKNQLIQAQIDLVSGGPPCQSFSLAGRREKDNNRNNLPWAYAEFVEIVKPKLVLLENVSGILRAFNTPNGKYYAWFEVAKAFALKGYVPICMHVNAKYFGLPQNRPRFIMLGIRNDIIDEKKYNDDEVIINSIKFFREVRKSKQEVRIEDVGYYKHYDLMNSRDASFFKSSQFLPTPSIQNGDEFKSVDYAIGDIKTYHDSFSIEKIRKNEYHKELEKHFPVTLNPNVTPCKKVNYYIENQNLRNHSKKIKNRFRFFKTIQNVPNGERNKIYEALRKGQPISINSKNLQIINLSFPEIASQDEFDNFIIRHASRKHSQRPLVKNLPAPAALSIPDDVCHYDPQQDRTLSVREMARIQTFPDWFVFRAKDTTGGINRRYEVPNYTQVGNAVPPLLAKKLGVWLIDLLKRLDNGI